MFPGYIRSLDDALAHIDDWARAMGGQRVNGIDAVETQSGATALKPFDIEFVGGHVLTVSATLRADLSPAMRGGEVATRLREQVMETELGAWLRPTDLGGGNRAEQVLSRLARDPEGPAVRVAKGLYYRSGPADPNFGKRKPSPVEVAAEVAKGQGVGPAAASAAAFLGLTTQVAPRPALAVAVAAPTGVEGVEWQTRNNVARAQLNFTEVAVVELLSIYPYGVEAEWNEVIERVAELRDARKIDLNSIEKVVLTERRKPSLRDNLELLLTVLEDR